MHKIHYSAYPSFWVILLCRFSYLILVRTIILKLKELLTCNFIGTEIPLNVYVLIAHFSFMLFIYYVYLWSQWKWIKNAIARSQLFFCYLHAFLWQICYANKKYLLYRPFLDKLPLRGASPVYDGFLWYMCRYTDIVEVLK